MTSSRRLSYNILYESNGKHQSKWEYTVLFYKRRMSVYELNTHIMLCCVVGQCRLTRSLHCIALTCNNSATSMYKSRFDSQFEVVHARKTKGNETWLIKQLHFNSYTCIYFFREGLVKHNPNTIRKVIAPFILTFKNGVQGIEKKLKNMVQNLGKLDDMPVYKESLQIAGK